MNNFQISDKGLNLIKEFEGCKLDAYLDTAGIPTIGWGHTLGVSLGLSCTQAQADKWLLDDVHFVEKAVNNMVTVDINQNQFDALCSFSFNLGVTALRTSTLLRKLNASNLGGAAAEFPRWNHSKGKVLPGLTRRRAAEKQLFEEA